VKLLRNKVLLVGAVCVAPVLAGWILYLFHWTPGNAGNYGELIAPRPLSGPPFDALRGKWVLVSFDAAACDAYCEKKLYFMRQVRRTQGKEMERVERLWAIIDGGKPRPEVIAAIEGTRVISFSDKSFSSDYIYLVDPLGNLMMRFPRDPDPSKMMKDLQRLLKYSRIG
jgi:hypothetical protein